MIELSAALLDMPKVSIIEITGGGTYELLSAHKAIFAEEGYSERFRELLRSERQARQAQLESLNAAEKRAMADAVCGCCNEEHRPRVAATIGAILKGDVSSLVLDEALKVDVPPALEQLGKLAELRILDLTRNHLPFLPEYLGSLQSLQQLLLYDCGLTELPASLGKLKALQKLEVSDNRLARLPDSFAELRALRDLGLFHNQLTILPQWVAQLPHLSVLNTDANPWQFPPACVLALVSSDEGGKDFGPLRRYFEAIDKHGCSTSRTGKMVLVGTGKAGKSSTLRGMKYFQPRPFAEDERTVQLDIWTLVLGDVPADGSAEDKRIVLSAWDFAGQPEYAAGQQQYLVQGALYLLLVPAHRATDDEADEVLHRWLSSLQAKAPGAAVQIVLSHVDRLEPLQAQLASLARRKDEDGDDLFETALEDLLDASPTALADAAAPQLSWLRGQVEARTERVMAAAVARGGTRPGTLRVQPEILCVCAAEGGDASLLALRQHLHARLTATPPLLPSIGFVLPNTWAPALALPIALREGRSLSSVHSPSTAAAVAPSASDPEAVVVKRPYVLLSELQSIWCDQIAPRAVPDQATPLSILTDALELLCNQGELFIAAGMVFLDPSFATELLKPLVDHTLQSAADAKRDVEKYVSATPGLASEEGLVERLLSEIGEFVNMGLMSPRLLPFFWRATALAPSDYAAAKRMLLDAGVLLEMGNADDDADGTRLMMPMRMPTGRPAAVAATWPSSVPLDDGVTQCGVCYGLSGTRLPPGVVERCVGSLSALEGWRPLQCWRHGVWLADARRSDSAGAAKLTALLELTSSELTVTVRGASGVALVLKDVLAPLVGAVERVLSEYPGFACDRKEL